MRRANARSDDSDEHETNPARAYDMGNPLLYDTSVDEGINLALRCAAERSHPATIQETVFECFMVMGVLNTNKHIYGSSHPVFIAQLDEELI
eukprot:8093405-Pyramimonas_sp.AAC.1